MSGLMASVASITMHSTPESTRNQTSISSADGSGSMLLHPHSLFENDPHADVIFSSADGILFHLQRKYLEANTGAFPGSEFDTRGEVTHLTEPATVLHLLFQFVYPRREPSIENLSFDTLCSLAEASEKYEVFHAMTICRIHMKSHAAKYPMKVLAHAARHDYPNLIQDTIPHLLRAPTADVMDQLPLKYIHPWVLFRESWDSCFERSIKEALELRIASPNATTKHALYFSRSLTPEICSTCLVQLITVLYQLKAIDTQTYLQEELAATRTSHNGCLSSACQYVNIIMGACTSLKARLDEVPSFSTFIPITPDVMKKHLD